MNPTKRGLLSLLLIALPLALHAQSLSEDALPEEADPDLYDLVLQPLDINSATMKQLLILPGIDETIAGKIIRYRDNYRVTNLNDLTNAGMARDAVERIRPYAIAKPIDAPGIVLRFRVNPEAVSVSNSYRWGNKTRALLDLDIFKLYGCFKFTNGQIIDTGALSNAKGYAQLALGDFTLTGGYYKIRLGQGLLFGSSYIANVDTLSGSPLKKSGGGISGDTSENTDSDGDGKPDQAFGAAVRWDLTALKVLGYYPDARLTAFYSHPLFQSRSAGVNAEADLPYSAARVGGSFVLTENSNSTNLPAGHVYFETARIANFSLYGELAHRGAYSGSLGLDWALSGFSALALGYLQQTDYEPLFGGTVLRAKSDRSGCFLGAGYQQQGWSVRYYEDWDTKLSDRRWESRRELKAVLPFLSGKDLGMELELKSRHTDSEDGDSVRSRAKLTLSFLDGFLKPSLAYQHMGHLTRSENGHLLETALDVKWNTLLRAKLSGSYFKTPSYASAVYATEPALFPGDSPPLCYYGEGAAASMLLTADITGCFALGVKAIASWAVLPDGSYRQNWKLEGQFSGDW